MSIELLYKIVLTIGLVSLFMIVNAQQIDTVNSSIKSALSELNIGKKYWKYCIILALLFFAAEIALIKLFKQ